jgi:hypothetical protein
MTGGGEADNVQAYIGNISGCLPFRPVSLTAARTTHQLAGAILPSAVVTDGSALIVWRASTPSRRVGAVAIADGCDLGYRAQVLAMLPEHARQRIRSIVNSAIFLSRSSISALTSTIPDIAAPLICLKSKCIFVFGINENAYIRGRRWLSIMLSRCPSGGFAFAGVPVPAAAVPQDGLPACAALDRVDGMAPDPLLMIPKLCASLYGPILRSLFGALGCVFLPGIESRRFA